MSPKRQPVKVPATLRETIRSHRVKPRASRGLTDKERRFVQEYCVELNASQAAIRAGYSRNTAAVIGFENLRKPKIAAAIAEWKARQACRAIMTRDQMQLEMQKIAGATMRDFGIDDSGDGRVDLSKFTRDQVAALNCKRQALMDLARLKGDLVDKVEHSGAIEHTNATTANAYRLGPERAQQLADELAAVTARIRAELNEGCSGKLNV